MKNYTSEIFGELKESETFTELISLITDNPNDFFHNVSMWRGQGDIKWPIHSGAYRRIFKTNERPVTEKDIIYYEESLLKRARHKGLGYIEGRRLNDIELLARLQHHGAATWFVDFSKNALIALWFCVDSQKNKTGLLLGVRSEYLGGNEGSLEEAKNYRESITKLHDYNHPMIVEPTLVSKRISAQHAVFLYSDVSSDAKGSLKISEENFSNTFIAISPKMKIELRKILIQVFDIRTETIYPDLDGFSAANSSEASTSDMWRW